MLSRFNEKLREFESNNLEILNHFQQLPPSKHFAAPVSHINLQPYDKPEKEGRFAWESFLNPPGNVFLQPPATPIEPLNYLDPVAVVVDKQENLKLFKSKVIEDKPKDDKAKDEKPKDEKPKDEQPAKDSIKFQLESEKLAEPETRHLKSKSAISFSHWSLNSDDDSIDLTILAHDGHNRLEMIFKYVCRLKTVLLIISIIGLVYQTIELSETYFRYPTIVDVFIQHNDKMIVPAITVCSPIQITPSELEKMFNDRPEVRRVLSLYDADEKMKSDEKQAKKFEYLRRYLQSAYLSRVTVNLSTYMEKSIQETKFVHSCYLSVLNSSDAQIQLPCKNFSKPTTTLTSNEICFTYFSETNKLVDSFDSIISFDEDGSAATAHISVFLTLNVGFDENYDINMPSFLYVHASNDIMAKSNGHALEPSRKYDVVYWRSVSERLPPLYCRSYSSSLLYPQSQIDCINRCSTDYTFLYCRCLVLKPPLRIETVPASARICPQLDAYFMRSCKRMLNGVDSKACRSKCNSDCIEQVFDFSVTAHEFTANEIMKIGGKINQSDLIEVHITRKLKPDVIYRQKYQLEFEQYFSNFCSLLGFWLGITVLTFYDQLKKNAILMYRLLCYVKTRMKDKRRKIKPKSRNI